MLVIGLTVVALCNACRSPQVSSSLPEQIDPRDSNEFRFIEGPRPAVTIGTPQGSVLLTYLPDGRLFSATPARAMTISPGANPTYEAESPLEGVVPDPIVVACSLDGQWIFAAEATGEYRIFDTSRGRAVWKGRTAGPAQPIFTEPGVLVLLDDRELRRIDCVNGTFEVIAPPTENLTELAVGGGWMAYTSSDFPEVRAISQSGETRAFENVKAFRQMSLSPDGRWLVLQGERGIRIYQVGSGEELLDRELNQEIDDTYIQIRWSANSERFALATPLAVYVFSLDRPYWAIKFWRYGLTIGDSVALSADGRSLASKSVLTGIAIWPNIDALINREE
jgi:WD40 repeat protein